MCLVLFLYTFFIGYTSFYLIFMINLYRGYFYFFVVKVMIYRVEVICLKCYRKWVSKFIRDEFIFMLFSDGCCSGGIGLGGGV